MGFFKYLFGNDENEQNNNNRPEVQTAYNKCIECYYCQPTAEVDENNQIIFVCTKGWGNNGELGNESLVTHTPIMQIYNNCGASNFESKY